MNKRDTRSEIVKIGTDLISRQGYTATGIDTVLREAGVPKGSFYHFFKSKEEFGLEVINSFAERYDKRLEMFLNDDEISPLHRVRNYLETGLARLEQNLCSKGCLIGNLGQELADSNERFRARLDEIFSSWNERFAACFEEARQRGELPEVTDPAMLASFVLSGWEGAILRAKVMKSPQPIRDFIRILFETALNQS